MGHGQGRNYKIAIVWLYMYMELMIIVNVLKAIIFINKHEIENKIKNYSCTIFMLLIITS